MLEHLAPLQRIAGLSGAQKWLWLFEHPMQLYESWWSNRPGICRLTEVLRDRIQSHVHHLF